MVIVFPQYNLFFFLSFSFYFQLHTSYVCKHLNFGDYYFKLYGDSKSQEKYESIIVCERNCITQLMFIFS
jgi:hypothetical protein